MNQDIYNKQSKNIQQLIDYVENPKEYSFNDSSKIVHEIFSGEYYNEKYYNNDLKEFNYDIYPYTLDLLVMLNTKDVILTDQVFDGYKNIIKYLSENPKKAIISENVQEWIRTRPDINRVVCKAIKEIDLTINEIYENLVSDIQDSNVLTQKQLNSMDFIFTQISEETFNFEIYKKIKEQNLFKEETNGQKILKENLKKRNCEEIFEKYIIQQLEENRKFTKYFIQKYDYWISYYCTNIKEEHINEDYLKTTKLSYILTIFDKICKTAKMNIDKTQTAKVLSSF